MCNGFVESNYCLSSFHVLNIEIIEWIANTFLACSPKRDRFEILFSLRSFTWTFGILHNTTIPNFVSVTREKMTFVKANFVSCLLEEQKP